MREFERGIFREFLISLFLRKRKGILSSLFNFLEKVFSVYTTPLTRRAASGMHKMKTKLA